MKGSPVPPTTRGGGETTVSLPYLERVGLSYFRRLSGAAGPVVADDEVHVLNPRERKALKAVQRGAITRAAVAGALSTAISAAAEVLAQPLLGHDPDHADLGAKARFWGIVIAATAFASVLEIAYLYWDGLVSVHRLAVVAGLDLFPEEQEDEDVLVARALARAALELPNPTARVFGVDPHREASRLGLVVASLVYKLKISVSNFLVKAFIGRILSRAVVRTWLPFVAVPITALWNGIVAWLVLREARIRAMGPSAAKEMIDAVLEDGGARLDAEGKRAMVSAVAGAIVRTRDLHPNLVALLHEVTTRFGEGGDGIDDSYGFLARLPSLAPAERRAAVQVLTVAAIVDGRLTSAERRLVAQARRAAGLPDELATTKALRRAFVSGDVIPPERLHDLARET